MGNNKYKNEIIKIDEIHNTKLKSFSTNFARLDYLSKTGDIMINYFDSNYSIQYNNVDVNETTEQEEQEQQYSPTQPEPCKKEDSFLPSSKLLKLIEEQEKNKKVKKPVKKRNNKTVSSISIFDYMDKNHDKTKINKSELQEQYLMLIKDDNFKMKNRIDKYIMCQNCDVEKELNIVENCFICPKCKDTELAIYKTEKTCENDTIIEKTKYPYKKINHFKEKLNQFQAKEHIDIPDEIFIAINNFMKKNNEPMKNISTKLIKKILKLNNKPKYYEHTQQIYCMITKTKPITLTRNEEIHLTNMFNDVQEPFTRYKSEGRQNFLNYSYVINKLFNIVGMPEYAAHFKLLKSSTKLKEQDAVWKLICNEKGWTYHPSI